MDANGQVAPTDAFSWRVFVRGVPRSVWAVLVLHVAILLNWSLLAPIYEAPDEPQHVDMVLHVADTWRWPTFGQHRLSERVSRSFEAIGFSETGSPFERRQEPVVAVDAPPRAERPSFAELDSGESTRWPNQLAQHPALYYGLGAALLGVLPGAQRWAFDKTVWALRLLSVALVAPLPVLAFVTAGRLTGRERVGVTAAAFPLALPMLSHIGSTVNNDNLLVLGMGLLTVAVVHVAGGDVTRRTAATAGVFAALAMLAKGFGLTAPLWAAAAYLLAAVRAPAWRPVARSGAVAVAVPGVLAGWWWLRNLVVYGTVQPEITLQPAPSGFVPRFGAWLERTSDNLLERFWGAFGWTQARVSEDFWVTATWVLLAVLAVALVVRRRSDPWGRADLVLLLAPTVGILALVAYGSWRGYVASGALYGVHGRYLFPAVVGLAVVAAVGLAAAAGRFAAWAPALVLGASGYTQSVGARTVLYHFYGHPGITDPAISVPAVLAWAPVPRAVTLAFVVLAALAACWAVAELALLGMRGGRFAGGTGTPPGRLGRGAPG